MLNKDPRVQKLVKHIIRLIDRHMPTANPHDQIALNSLKDMYAESLTHDDFDLAKINLLYLMAFVPDPYDNLYLSVHKLDRLIERIDKEKGPY